MRFRNGYLSRWWVPLLIGLIYATTSSSDQIIGRHGSSIRGGVYVGKVRPYYWDRILYLEPINPVIQSSPPSCTRRKLLRLGDEETSIAFANKFNLLLHSWLDEREVILVGTGTCTGEGDEQIMVVIPQ